jgi:hypothetical protein
VGGKEESEVIGTTQANTWMVFLFSNTKAHMNYLLLLALIYFVLPVSGFLIVLYASVRVVRSAWKHPSDSLVQDKLNALQERLDSMQETLDSIEDTLGGNTEG